MKKNYRRQTAKRVPVASKHAKKFVHRTEIWGEKGDLKTNLTGLQRSGLEPQGTRRCWSSAGVMGKRLSQATTPEGKAHHKRAQAVGSYTCFQTIVSIFQSQSD